FITLFLRCFSLVSGWVVAIAFLSCIFLYAFSLLQLVRPRHIARTASLGYAIPGAVSAVGVMIPMMKIDRAFIWLTSDHFGMLLSGTLFILLIAYIVRFMAVGYNAIDAGFQKTGASVNEVARSLGASSIRTLL